MSSASPETLEDTEEEEDDDDELLLLLLVLVGMQRMCVGGWMRSVGNRPNDTGGDTDTDTDDDGGGASVGLASVLAKDGCGT